MATNNSINIGVVAGSGQTYTFPAATDTLVARTSTDTLTNKTLTTPVINGTITGTGQATGATASTITMRDANANITAVNHIEAYNTTATAAGTTTLTVGSSYQQYFTGSSTQTVTLPVASTLAIGQQYLIVNNSTGLVTVNSSGANAVLILAGSTSAIFTCILTSGTTAASWSYSYIGDAVATGKKLIISNILTLAGTDNTTMTFPSTSATIARTDAANTFTGHQTIEGVTSTGATGTGKFVFDGTPTLVTPVLGAATVTSLTAAANTSINMIAGTYNTIQTYTPSAAGTATLDLSKGNIHHITMPAGNITIAISNGTAGQCFIVRILQDGTGSRTVTWFTTIKWAGGSAPTLTTTASKADTLGFEVTTAGSAYDGYVVGQNI